MLFIIFGVITLFDFITTPRYAIFEFFTTASFIITIICGLILILTPGVIKFISTKGRELLNDMRIRDFTLNFNKNFKGTRHFNLEDLSKKYKISYDDLKKIFEDLLSKGYIQGELVGKHFDLDNEFEIGSFEEINIKKFKENIIEYVKPYRWLNISKTAKFFKVNEEIVRSEISKLLSEKKLMGFLDGDNLVRELSMISMDLNDMPECPYCDSKVLAHSIFCSNCGKKIGFDKLLRDTEE